MAKALLGKAAIPDRSPYTTGGIGLLGTAPSQDALQECDTFIIAGTSFPIWNFSRNRVRRNRFRSTSTRPASGLRHPADVGLVGDCRSVLRALIPLINERATGVFWRNRKSEWRPGIS